MIEEMVARAKVAADIIATYETSLGDKVTKRNKRNKIKLILRGCLLAKSFGIIAFLLQTTNIETQTKNLTFTEENLTAGSVNIMDYAPMTMRRMAGITLKS